MPNSTLRIPVATLTAAAALALFTPGAVRAAGFAITEQSASALGSAYAGAAAEAKDASTIFFNPAGLTQLTGRELVIGAHWIDPSAQFSGTASIPAMGGAPVSGSSGGDAALSALIPNLYYAAAVNARWHVGLGVNVPFGLRTDYNEDWKGRYQAVRSDLKTVAVNPTVAYRLSDRLSLGAGISAVYADATLSNAVDNSVLCLGTFPAAACAGSGLITPGTPATDGFAKVQGDSWGWGFNLGLLYQPAPGTRVGISYRSKVHETLTGTAVFSNVPALFTGNDLFVNSGAKAEITLPDTASVSIDHALTGRLALLGDVTWTHWSRFDNLVIQYDQGAQGPTVQPERWSNTYRFSLGLRYRYSPAWTLRTGIAYDQTPIDSAALRTPRIPGNDRRWLAFGATYRYSPTLGFDLGYAHLFVSNTSIDHLGTQGHLLSGAYDSSVDIVGAQADWKF